MDRNHSPPSFETAVFRAAFLDLLTWRRDVRHFRGDPLADELVTALLQAAELAPSVGLSQPWRFVRVRSPGRRAAVRVSFERCNAEALGGYDGADAARYARMKLSGLSEAPEHLAVFSDLATDVGRGLGRRTMPETLDYSVVGAIQTLWLFARCHGIGVGWVSILDPAEIAKALEVPPAWKLIAYLCLGYPQADSEEPELQQAGWERRLAPGAVVTER